ncbi:MAG: hypothetical protein R2710_04565 [Acidimicrobiales bacterium]
MSMARMPKVLRLLLVLTVLALAAPCGGSSDGLASATDATTATTGEERQPTTTTAGSETTGSGDTDAADDSDSEGSSSDGSDSDGSDSDDATDTGAATGADDGSCLEGEWDITEDELAAYYAALGEASGVPMTATGSARFEFLDQHFVYNAVFELEMDLSGQIANAEADGVAEGSYEASDGVITTELESNSMNITVNVGGWSSTPAISVVTCSRRFP